MFRVAAARNYAVFTETFLARDGSAMSAVRSSMPFFTSALTLSGSIFLGSCTTLKRLPDLNSHVCTSFTRMASGVASMSIAFGSTPGTEIFNLNCLSFSHSSIEGRSVSSSSAFS